MTDLLDQIIWLVGAAAIITLIGIAYYAITKIGALVLRRPVEVDSMFFFGGAFIGMFFLPSSNHATTESRIMLAVALIVGAFVGGLVGLFVDVIMSMKPSPDSGSPQGEGVASGRHWGVIGISAIGRFLFVLLLALCAGIVITVSLGDIPLLSPLIQLLQHLL